MMGAFHQAFHDYMRNSAHVMSTSGAWEGVDVGCGVPDIP